jgi:hypothetical protein
VLKALIPCAVVAVIGGSGLAGYALAPDKPLSQRQTAVLNLRWSQDGIDNDELVCAGVSGGGATAEAAQVISGWHVTNVPSPSVGFVAAWLTSKCADTPSLTIAPGAAASSSPLF